MTTNIQGNASPRTTGLCTMVRNSEKPAAKGLVYISLYRAGREVYGYTKRSAEYATGPEDVVLSTVDHNYIKLAALNAVRAQLKIEEKLSIDSIRYSRTAGCRCGCSPGYTLENVWQARGKTIWVDVLLDGTPVLPKMPKAPAVEPLAAQLEVFIANLG